MSPHYANGKICYLEIPALEVQRSADFYAKVFGFEPPSDVEPVEIENL